MALFLLFIAATVPIALSATFFAARRIGGSISLWRALSVIFSNGGKSGSREIDKQLLPYRILAILGSFVAMFALLQNVPVECARDTGHDRSVGSVKRSATQHLA